MTSLTDPQSVGFAYIEKYGSLIDMLLTDHLMPGLSGVELTRRVRKMSLHIPIVMLSGYGNEVDPHNYATFGLDDFILKPAQPLVILRTVRKYLNKYS